MQEKLKPKILICCSTGLTSLEANKPLASSAAAAQGYNAGIVAVLEDEAALAAYNEKSNGAT
jgi:hypothetical protein